MNMPVILRFFDVASISKILDMAYILIYILIIKIFDMQNILNLFKHKEEKKR